MNYYNIIGVKPDASQSDITQAFHRKLQEINERNPPEKIEELKALIEAFAILSNEEKRRDYDTFLHTGEALVLEDKDGLFQSTSLVERIRFERTRNNIEQNLPTLITKLDNLLTQVQDQKVRLKYKGKQVGPDIPMTYAIAMEAVGLLGAGMVRTIIANLGIKSFFDVEVISQSEEFVRKGDDYFQVGEMEAAEREYHVALNMNPKSALAQMRLGVLSRIQGRKDEARAWFKKVLVNAQGTKLAEDAQRQLDKLQ